MENAADKLKGKAKGKAKETVGKVTGDDDMRREGKVDKTKANLKDKVDDVADKVKDAIHKD